MQNSYVMLAIHGFFQIPRNRRQSGFHGTTAAASHPIPGFSYGPENWRALPRFSSKVQAGRAFLLTHQMGIFMMRKLDTSVLHTWSSEPMAIYNDCEDTNTTNSFLPRNLIESCQ